MKKLLLAFMAVMSLTALPACSTIDTVAAVHAPLGQNTVLDEKAYYAMEALYNVPAQAYVTLSQKGLLTPSLKANFHPKLITLNRIRKDAELAYRAGNTTGFSAKFEAMKTLSSEIKAGLGYK